MTPSQLEADLAYLSNQVDLLSTALKEIAEPGLYWQGTTVVKSIQRIREHARSALRKANLEPS